MREYLLNFTLTDLPTYYTDLLIIGSGIAGLSAAIYAAEYGNVLVLTKSYIDEATTKYAQGGIAYPIGEDDSEELHINDTLNTGCGLCNKEKVRILIKEGKQRVNELIKWGVKFEREGSKLHLSKEAAHTTNRIIHCSGYQTGEKIEKVLVRKVKRNKKIVIKEQVFVIDLLTHNGSCLGCIALNNNNNKIEVYLSKVTILSTGGAGQIYKITTNPNIATGDGISIGYRAGCLLSDLEFIQFHPTAIIRDNKVYLITEAVRGEGGILKDDKGRRFMVKKHPLYELAPRDILSRCIFEKMKNNEKIFLDLTHFDPVECKKRFPYIYKICKNYNLDITVDLIDITPAAHYIMGGIVTDENGKTNINRLFAIGEVACTFIHGANRLASNSILEGLVFSKRCIEYCVNNNILGQNFKVNIGNIGNKKKMVKNNIEVAKIKQTIKEIMWNNVGIIRTKESLKKALIELGKLKHILNYHSQYQEEFEVKNMLQLATLITKSALLREESRGTHYREDFKKQDDKNWKKHIIWYKKNNRDHVTLQSL